MEYHCTNCGWDGTHERLLRMHNMAACPRCHSLRLQPADETTVQVTSFNTSPQES